jgi:hypothetical protein
LNPEGLGVAEFTVSPNPGTELVVFATEGVLFPDILKVGLGVVPPRLLNPELPIKPEVLGLGLNKELPEVPDGFVVLFDTPNAVELRVEGVVSPNPKPPGLLLEDKPKPEVPDVCGNREDEGLEVLFNSELLEVVEGLVIPKPDPNEELKPEVGLELFVPKALLKVDVELALPKPEFEKLNPVLLAGVALLLELVPNPNPLFPELV